MDIDVQSLEVRNNTEEEQFEVPLNDGDLGVIVYRMHGEDVYVMLHTEVPPAYGGKGIADKLVHDALDMVRAEGKKVIAICPYVKAYIKRHPDYQDLAA
jgi:predicted GNAT family acetyltransferase